MNAVDTNVLIYACDKSDPGRRRIARETVRRTHGGVLPWQVAVEFVAAARRLTPQGFTAEAAWARLRGFLRVYRLTLPTRTVLGRARALHVEQHWSVWDALIVAACLDAGVTRLFSEDLPGRRAPDGLEIINPFA